MYGPYKWEISYRMTGMVKIKTKENGSMIKIHTVYRIIQPNNPATYMGR